MTAHEEQGPDAAPGGPVLDERAAAPYVGDAAVSDDVKTLFSKQNGLQAVRGLGTSLVIFHHMTGSLVNAAAVFDAFFVISGYLISIRLILLAQTANIRDYFVTFYTFRVRRILPVAVLTLAATALVAHLIYVPSRAHDATVDVLYALFFMANVHFAHDGTNYFQQGGVVSPVLNFWSLSVEEQFYLAWPLVILVALWIAHRRGRGTGVTPVALVIIAASFAYGWWDTATHPVAAYYSTLGRVWDFGIGALMANLAVGQAQHNSRSGASSSGKAPLLVRLNRRFAPYAGQIAWLGVVLVVLAMFFTPNIGYPVPAASFGMVGMGIVFFANTLKRDPSRLFANARPFIWLGDMSYSLYVVHFPVIVFASSYIKGDNTLLYAFDVAASLALAVLMFNFVEKPARQSLGRTKAWFRAGGHQPVLLQAMTCAFVAALLFAFASRTVAPLPADAEGAAPAAPGASTAPPRHRLPPIPDEVKSQIPPNLASIAEQTPADFSDPHLVPASPELTRAIADAVGLRAWPELTNGSRIERTEQFVDQCNDVDHVEPSCVAAPASGTDPAKVAVAFGDSTMLAYWPMLKAAMVPHGWTVVMFGLTACPAALVNALGGGNLEECARHHAAYGAVLQRWHPSVVFLGNAEHTDVEVVRSDGSVLPQARSIAAYQNGLQQAVALVSAHGARSIVLSPPPAGYALATCDVAGSSPQDCVLDALGTWFLLNRTDRAVAERAGAAYADLLPFFCHGITCPSVVGDLAVRADNLHETPEYAELTAPSFESYLLGSGIVR